MYGIRHWRLCVNNSVQPVVAREELKLNSNLITDLLKATTI